jgi:hypothetical protein
VRIPDPFESGYPVGLALAPQAWRGAGSDHRLPEVGLAVRRTLHSVLPDEHDELHDTALSRIQPATSNIFLREHALRLRSPSPAMRPSPSPGRRDLEGRYTQSTGDVGLWAEASEEWAEEAVEHQGLMSVKSMTVIPRLSVSRSEKRLGGGSSPLVRTPPRHLTPRADVCQVHDGDTAPIRLPQREETGRGLVATGTHSPSPFNTKG